MSGIQIESDAFARAALRSERLRMIGLIAVALVALLVTVTRAIVVGSEEQLRFAPRAGILVAVIVVYEWIMIGIVSRMIRLDREPPGWMWVLNVLIEGTFPTAVILLTTHSDFMGPFRSLAGPIVLFYFFLILLSTLRLRPSLCVLTGFCSAIYYLGATVYTYLRFADMESSASLFGAEIYATFGVGYVLGGLAAGGVARQIQTHVRAALREAEARKQVEQFEHDLGIARSIQQSLLPRRPPEIEGYQIAGWSRPADQTGGDYYDWQELPDGRLAVSLADVTGHGIGPALVTAVCRAYSRASLPSGQEVGALLTRINSLLVDDLPADRFVTFVVALLDPRTSQVELLSAGHGPLFLYTARDGRVQEFDAHNIPFGLSPDVPYGPAQRIDLGPGDLLVLLTDGFFEWAQADGEQFGTNRIEQVIRACKDNAPDQIIAELHAAVTEFAQGAKQQDDLTAVVLKRSARAGTGSAEA